jgi:ribosomal protein L11 methyltransferase
MMIKWMKEIDHKGKSVLDFGTGTGVLAILAEKLGSSKIEAIDNDDWSIENANENILYNGCSRIVLHKADSLDFMGQYDILLANINKNVLLANMEKLQQHLAKEGVLVISGLLEGDRSAIETAANRYKLAVNGQMINNGWISLKLTHY